MRINADFSRRAIVAAHQYEWVASPQAGVARVMLDRIGGEKARATSIVRYAAGSRFPPHAHPGGEEIFVLSGTFSDAEAHFPAGCYLRNPPGSSHQPFSDDGAVIFVKLWQMPPDEHAPVRIDTRDPAAWHGSGARAICPLYAGRSEQVCLQRFAPGDIVFPDAIDSAELLVLAGDLVSDGQAYARGTWMRLPPGAYRDLITGPQGATVYLKTGHLAGIAARAP